MENPDFGAAVTRCFGRHLIEFPRGNVTKVRSIVGGASVEVRRPVTVEEFSALVAESEAQLRVSLHRNREPMFRGRVDFDPYRVFLSSWFSSNSQATTQDRLYSLMPDSTVMHLFSVEGSGRNPDRARNYLGRLSRNLRYRNEGEIPGEPGFCIEQGLVTLSKLNKEEVTAGIKLSELPGVTFNFMSYVTGAPDKPLLRRTSTTPPGYEGTSAGMKSLRSGDRNIGSIKGQELLVRGDAGGKRSYEFLWESQGQKASIEHPFLSLRMTSTDETDGNGEIMDAPFESDAQALALWDSILNTLRLRPGAISAGGADLR